LAQRIDRPLGSFLLARDQHEICGMVSFSGKRDGSLFLESLYVLPEHQGNGVGKALFAAGLRRYPHAGHVALNVLDKNARAISVYESLGFVELSRSEFDGLPQVHMHMELRGTGSVDLAPVMVRPVRDADAQDLIGLITLCFAEYPGCFFDPHGDMPDIVRPAQSRMAIEGQFLVVEDATGRVCACIGADLPEYGTAELHRLYVRPDMRGRGLGKELTRRMEDVARERGATRMILWSDTRFTTAHAMYEGLGYTRGGATRSLGDISLSREFFFEKPL
jgi:GNAT superfamily N-acetyltransferase